MRLVRLLPKCRQDTKINITILPILRAAIRPSIRIMVIRAILMRVGPPMPRSRRATRINIPINTATHTLMSITLTTRILLLVLSTVLRLTMACRSKIKQLIP